MYPAPPAFLLKYLEKGSGTNSNFLGTIRTNLEQLAHKFSGPKSEWGAGGMDLSAKDSEANIQSAVWARLYPTVGNSGGSRISYWEG